MALQGQHKEEDQADDRCDANNGPEDKGVYLSDCKAQKCDGDRDLCDCADPDIASLAEPPPLRNG
jgi:hypothetical protein